MTYVFFYLTRGDEIISRGDEIISRGDEILSRGDDIIISWDPANMHIWGPCGLYPGKVIMGLPV